MLTHKPFFWPLLCIGQFPEPRLVLQALSKDVFTTYVCRTIKHPESRPHPGDIAEATSLR